MHAWDTTLEFRDTFAWQRGHHAMRFGGDFRRYIWPMWGFFQNRGFYQYTNGYTTQFGINDGSGSGFASLLLSLPSVKQRQAGIPQMNLRNWGWDGFAEDSWQVNPTTTLSLGVRYEYTSPLYDLDNTNTNLLFQGGVPSVFIGGQQDRPKGLMYANRHNFAPRLGIAKNLPRSGLVLHAAYGIFYTPVDQNTWCNQRHNVPYVFPETQQADNFTPPAALFANGLNFGTPVLGIGTLPATTVSFTAFDPHSPAQYVQQWNARVEKTFASNTTLEVGYLGARGFHLQRSHLINNAPPGPGPLGPRRPFKTLTFVPGTVLTPSSTDAVIQSQTFPMSTINLLEDSAQSWYDAGYVNVRRRYARGLSFLANYTFSKTLTNAPDFRSPMGPGTYRGNGHDVHHAHAANGQCDRADNAEHYLQPDRKGVDHFFAFYRVPYRRGFVVARIEVVASRNHLAHSGHSFQVQFSRLRLDDEHVGIAHLLEVAVHLEGNESVFIVRPLVHRVLNLVAQGADDLEGLSADQHALAHGGRSLKGFLRGVVPQDHDPPVIEKISFAKVAAVFHVELAHLAVGEFHAARLY